jgi:MFS family permease
MTEYIVDSIGVVSVAKILGVVGLLWGIVLAISWIVLGGPMGGRPGLPELLLLIAIIGGTVYGVSGDAITAVIYNAAAGVTGGIELEMSRPSDSCGLVSPSYFIVSGRLSPSMQIQRAAGSALLGAVVSIVAGFLPFVSFVAPLLGGGVAGYLHRAGLRDGAGAGALMGVFLALLGVVLQILSPVLPAFPAAVVLGPWARGFGLGMLNSIVAIIAASAILLVLVGAVGGAIGGALAGQRAQQTNETLG